MLLSAASSSIRRLRLPNLSSSHSLLNMTSQEAGLSENGISLHALNNFLVHFLFDSRKKGSYAFPAREAIWLPLNLFMK